MLSANRSPNVGSGLTRLGWCVSLSQIQRSRSTWPLHGSNKTGVKLLKNRYEAANVPPTAPAGVGEKTACVRLVVGKVLDRTVEISERSSSRSLAKKACGLLPLSADATSPCSAMRARLQHAWSEALSGFAAQSEPGVAF